MAETLRSAGISEVLVVGGDPPHDIDHVAYPQSSVDLIRRVKRELPDLTVYAAVDPYRQGFRAERDYISRKLDAGAGGFCCSRAKSYFGASRPSLRAAREPIGKRRIKPSSPGSSMNSNAYLMPIRVDLAEYLDGLM